MSDKAYRESPKIVASVKVCVKLLAPCQSMPNSVLEYEGRETISECDKTENYKITEDRRRYKANLNKVHHFCGLCKNST